MKKNKIIKHKLQATPIKNDKHVLARINAINKNSFSLFVFLIFAFVVGIGMYYHEPWRDELVVYMMRKYYGIMNNNVDPSFLVYNGLIKFCLFFIPNIFMFQLFHYFVILMAVFLFTFCSPLTNLEKLLSFNYFFVYEYGIISRWYGFLILILFLIIYLISKPKRNYFLIVVLILVLANHTGIATIFAASISLYLFIDVYNKIISKKLLVKNNYVLILSAIIFVIGWAGVLTIHYLFTFKLATFMGSEFGSSPVFLTIKDIWNTFIPIPDLTKKVMFWNTNIIPFFSTYPPNYDINYFLTPANKFAFIISVVILLISVVKFIDKPIVLTTFLFNMIVYFVFMQSLKIYVLRYQGLFFIIFLYSFWLYHISNDKTQITVINKLKRYLSIFRKPFIVKLFGPMLFCIIIAQIYSTSYALSKEIKYKFTYSQDAAAYIKQYNFNNTHVLVGYPEYAAEGISANVDKKIFFPQYGEYDYFFNNFNLNTKRENPSSDFSQVVNACTNFTEKQNKKVLLILNSPLMDNTKQLLTGPAKISNNSTIKLLKSFSGDVIEGDEQYWLYEVNKITN